MEDKEQKTERSSDSPPVVGAYYHYAGDNVVVTRYDQHNFIMRSDDSEDWQNAVEFQDLVGSGETATKTYIMSKGLFNSLYTPGNVRELGGDSADEYPGDAVEDAGRIDNTLPTPVEDVDRVDNTLPTPEEEQ